ANPRRCTKRSSTSSTSEGSRTNSVTRGLVTCTRRATLNLSGPLGPQRRSEPASGRYPQRRLGCELQRLLDTDTNMVTANSGLGNGAAWLQHAHPRAAWAEERLVNRRDAFGAYRPECEIGREYQKQDGSKGTLGEQLTVKRPLTRAALVRHFRAIDRCAII